MKNWLGIRRRRPFRQKPSAPPHPSEEAGPTPPPLPPEPRVAVRYTPVRCPRCLNRKGLRKYAMRLPVRFHRCPVCEYCFKSVEQYDD